MKKALSVFIFFSCFYSFSHAQVSAVKYLIEYNDLSGHYDVKLYIEAGSATTLVDRVQFNAQVSVVVPTGSNVGIGEFFNPINDNGFYTGTVPMEWHMGDGTIAPPAQPENDFYEFFPNLAVVSHYNDLFAGDTVTLFSLDIDVEPCTNSIRLFDNGEDPGPDVMPNGENYSNFFTIGGVEDRYNGNLTSWYSGDWLVELDDYQICSGECVELVPVLVCSSDDITYLWSTGESSPTISVCPEMTTTYTVVVTDPNGATLNLESEVTVIPTPAAPIVGEHDPICEGQDIVLTAEGVDGAIYSWEGPDNFTSDEQNPTLTNVTVDASGSYACFIEINGCGSDAGITEVEVIPPPMTMITGEDSLCVGELSSIAPSTGGIWTSSNNAVASVTNAGSVTAISEGTVQFYYTSVETGCVSLPSDTIWVFEEGVAEILEEDRLCIGETSLAGANGVGTWTSNNVSVATIDANTGVITAVGQGAVKFTFVNAVSGCSAMTPAIIVDPIPTVSVEDTEICLGDSTVLTPASGGVWQALDTGIASLTDNVVTGVAPGVAKFVYTSNATGCTSDTLFVTVNALPEVYLEGPNVLCPGSISQVSNDVPGTWATNEAIIATVDNLGNVTAISEGCTFLTFTETGTGCKVVLEDTICVLPTAAIELPHDSVCIGESFVLTTGEEGVWASTDTLIATIDSLTGMVLTKKDGIVRFSFTADDNGCTSYSLYLTVNPPPFENASTLQWCVGGIGLIDIPLQGEWSSSDTSILQFSGNSSAFTAVGVGDVSVFFVSSSTGCEATMDISVNELPEISTMDTTICVGTSLPLSPYSGGSWSVVEGGVLPLSSLGIATAVFPGSYLLVFTDSSTGCSSEPLSIEVVENPEIQVIGPDTLCIGSTTQLSSIGEGVWSSSDADVASIDSAGLVTAHTEGMAVFTFDDGQCSAISDSIHVLELLTMNIDTTICEGMEYEGLAESGIYTIDSVDAVTGCALQITIHLDVLPLDDPLCTVSIEEEIATRFKLYPNPARHEVTIEGYEAIDAVSVFNLEYQNVAVRKSKINDRQWTITTEELPSGFYFVVMEANGRKVYKKLIVE